MESTENTPSSHPDEQVARLVQSGDAEAFGVLMKRYEPKIFRYSRKFLKSSEDCQDMVQETFVKAYRNIQSFDTTRKFSSWLYRIAHNECINFLKKKRVESVPLFDLDVLMPHAAVVEQKNELEQQEIKELMDRSLDSIDLKYREPLVLYYLEGFDYKEIADILRIPIATVGVRLKRAKVALKQQYPKNNKLST